MGEVRSCKVWYWVTLVEVENVPLPQPKVAEDGNKRCVKGPPATVEKSFQ